MRPWSLHHIVAMCQDCPWNVAEHGVRLVGSHSLTEKSILEAARRHAQKNEHYVQVERGQHAHYDCRPPDLPPKGEA